MESLHSHKFLEADYVGVDIGEFKEKLPLVSSDVFFFEYPQNQVDTVLAIALLEHIALEHWEHLIKAWKSALKPGGHLVIIVPEQDLGNYLTIHDGEQTDYEKDKTFQQENHVFLGHRVFGITKKALLYFLPEGKVKRIRRPFVFKNDKESYLWATGRAIKRFITGNRYIWDFILRKKWALMVIWQKAKAKGS